MEGAAVGWKRTAERGGWRRDWPLTHSHLSRTGEDLRREAEAIDEVKNLIFFVFSPTLCDLVVAASWPQMGSLLFVFIVD